ncbi:trace amine-associated receptor 13c-like [Aulostomus maculatus]
MALARCHALNYEPPHSGGGGPLDVSQTVVIFGSLPSQHHNPADTEHNSTPSVALLNYTTVVLQFTITSLMMDVQDKAELCFPEHLNTSCRKPTTTSLSETVLLSFLLIISLLTVFLNLLVIISVSYFRQLHTPTNILLLSLAVSDFLVGLLLMPGDTFRQTSCWYLGDQLCSLGNFISLSITSASIGHMVLISVDRYVAICDPLHYTSRVTVRRVKGCVCLCWLCSLFYSSIILKADLKTAEVYFSCHGQCVVFINYISASVDLVVSFFGPVTIIIILYMRVFVVAVSQARAMRSHMAAVKLNVPVSVTPKKSELKAARTIAVVLLVFLIMLCPYYCVSLAGYHLLNDTSAAYALSLFLLNSCFNPLIYALFYPWFRKAIKLIVTLQILQPGSDEVNIL